MPRASCPRSLIACGLRLSLLPLLGMPWARSNLQSPIQHTAMQVTQRACWRGRRRRSASLLPAPTASLWHEASPIQSPVAHGCHVHGGCRCQRVLLLREKKEETFKLLALPK